MWGPFYSTWWLLNMIKTWTSLSQYIRNEGEGGVEIRTGEEGGIGVPTEGRGVGGGVRTGGEGGVGLRTGEEGGNSTLYLSVWFYHVLF